MRCWIPSPAICRAPCWARPRRWNAFSISVFRISCACRTTPRCAPRCLDNKFGQARARLPDRCFRVLLRTGPIYAFGAACKSCHTMHNTAFPSEGLYFFHFPVDNNRKTEYTKYAPTPREGVWADPWVLPYGFRQRMDAGPSSLWRRRERQWKSSGITSPV